jgi:hypothetical protein
VPQQNIAGPDVMTLPHGMALWFVAKPFPGAVAGDDIGDCIGTPNVDGLALGAAMAEDGTMVVGDGLGVESVRKGLTPALPISTDPIGIPGRDTPLGDSESVAPVEDAVLATVAHDAAAPGIAVPVPAPSPIPPPS